jgi:hypothetical protein
MMNQKMILIKATIGTRDKLRELTGLLNETIIIGKVRQTDALEYAINNAIKTLKNG